MKKKVKRAKRACSRSLGSYLPAGSRDGEILPNLLGL